MPARARPAKHVHGHELARKYRELTEVSGGGDREQRLRLAEHLEGLAKAAEEWHRKKPR